MRNVYIRQNCSVLGKIITLLTAKKIILSQTVDLTGKIVNG